MMAVSYPVTTVVVEDNRQYLKDQNDLTMTCIANLCLFLIHVPSLEMAALERDML